jgi:hypothetical protein
VLHPGGEIKPIGLLGLFGVWCGVILLGFDSGCNLFLVTIFFV